MKYKDEYELINKTMKRLVRCDFTQLTEDTKTIQYSNLIQVGKTEYVRWLQFSVGENDECSAWTQRTWSQNGTSRVTQQLRFQRIIHLQTFGCVILEK